jgi:hypothetical protein
MRRLFDHRNQQMTRSARHALIIALLVLLLPMEVWAHKCGPSELTVGKGNIITYTIAGHDFVPTYKIVDKGDPLVAIIEPPVDVDNVHLVFKITGTGAGTTVFKIYWKGARNHDTCPVKVTVSG